ncbi:uncharacterized protein LOC130049562 [Ostrea edulis]|uniref:uncharacterized protein LOC130049562 n=1 Tax=Ostrea edulis TaxID=37623 RepID=UPI0024AF148C|nr:uncharacterized protein LOC130049562 [Ostrea edulis]
MKTKSKRNYNSDEEDNLNQEPEFIRVFLYDTNFDVKLKASLEEEEQAALKASGVVEMASEDKLTVLQRKMKMNINERTSKILTAITTMKRGLKSSNKGGFRTLRKMDSLEDTSSRDSENYDSD